MIELGTEVTDPITGYKGIATAKTLFLHGCVRIGITAKKNKDGDVPRTEWFDEPQLIAGKKKFKSRDDLRSGALGGPMSSIPTRNSANY